MNARSGFFLQRFLREFPYEPTDCQKRLLQELSDFLSADDGDILVVNGYAGTGKTTAVAAVVSALESLELRCVLLAPTGRSAKVLSLYAGRAASTIHKHIYRQKSMGNDGFGAFSLAPNKAKGSLFIVDEVSLIGIASDGSGGAFGSGNLLEDLVQFVRSGVDCKLVLIGDDAQLPPVGLDASPALSRAYMDGFGGVSYTALNTVVRQANDSGILRNATHLRSLLPLQDSPDCLGLQTGPDVARIGGAELLDALSDAYGKYGEDEVIVLCRSNKRAGRYNAGIRAQVLYREEKLVRGDKLMVVKNHYSDALEGADYIANGDTAELVWIRHYEERYGLHFADACLSFPDYRHQEVQMKVLLDTLDSDSPSLGYAQAQALYQGVSEDYAHLSTKKKRYDAVREDPFFNALQIKYAHAITCHKAQGGQWRCVFIDNPVWQEELTEDDIKWLYTAFTRAVDKVFLVNFSEKLFQ